MPERQERAKLTVRLPTKLHLQLADQAKQSGRTLNAEITYRLKQSLEGYWR